MQNRHPEGKVVSRRIKEGSDSINGVIDNPKRATMRCCEEYGILRGVANIICKYAKPTLYEQKTGKEFYPNVWDLLIGLTTEVKHPYYWEELKHYNAMVGDLSNLYDLARYLDALEFNRYIAPIADVLPGVLIHSMNYHIWHDLKVQLLISKTLLILTKNKECLDNMKAHVHTIEDLRIDWAYIHAEFRRDMNQLLNIVEGY